MELMQFLNFITERGTQKPHMDIIYPSPLLIHQVKLTTNISQNSKPKNQILNKNSRNTETINKL